MKRTNKKQAIADVLARDPIRELEAHYGRNIAAHDFQCTLFRAEEEGVPRLEALLYALAVDYKTHLQYYAGLDEAHRTLHGQDALTTTLPFKQFRDLFDEATGRCDPKRVFASPFLRLEHEQLPYGEHAFLLREDGYFAELFNEGLASHTRYLSRENRIEAAVVFGAQPMEIVRREMPRTLHLGMRQPNPPVAWYEAGQRGELGLLFPAIRRIYAEEHRR